MAQVDSVVAVEPPGRLPTVLRETGTWSRAVEAVLGESLRWVSLNVAFWARQCEAEVDRLLDPASYLSASTFVDAIKPLASAIGRSAMEGDFTLTWDRGPVVSDMDTTAAGMLAFARDDGELSGHVEELVRSVEWSSAPLVFLTVTSPQELLTALMTAVAVKRVRPASHVCLADHAWENFSLHRHFARPGAASPLLEIFDSVLPSRLTQAGDVVALLERLGIGQTIKVRTAEKDRDDAMAPGRTLAPLVLWTRIDDGTCYWGRCTFCVQNDKAGNQRSAVSKAAQRARERMAEFEASGVRRVILSDEAIHPRVLESIAESGGHSLAWAARVKVDRHFDEVSLRAASAAGCVELLVGMESASPHVQRLMDKYDADEIERMPEFFDAIAGARIGLHLNVLAGFPSESTREFRATWVLAKQILGRAWLPSFSMNWFALFPGSPIADHPDRFGVREVRATGDLAQQLQYRLGGRDRRRSRGVLRMLDDCEADLWRAASGGTSREVSPEAALAGSLFSGSGFGLLLKANGIGLPEIHAAASMG